MATLQEKIYEHEDFFINKILYPMTKRKFDTLNQGARKRFIEAEENGIKDTSKLKEIQKLLATAPNWYETEFIDVDVKTFMDKCKKKFDNSYEEYIDDIKAFICQIYVETSRNLWDNVELFTDSCSNAVKDKNQEKIKKIIADTVKEQVKEFEVPKELDKFEALTELLDREDDNVQKEIAYDYHQSDNNSLETSNEDVMFGGNTMISNKDDDNEDTDEEDHDNDKKEEDHEDTDEEEKDHDDVKEDTDEEDDDSVIEVDITPSKNKKEKQFDDDNKDENDLFAKSEDEQDENDEQDEEDEQDKNDEQDEEDEEDEQNKNDENDEQDEEDENDEQDKKVFKMNKSKVMNIMEEAEKKLQDDPDLTDENIENFLKFKKFLEMTKKVKVENFEEVLQKALETPKEVPEEKPVPKPRKRRASPKSKPATLEPSFEEIVEEESLGLFDAPLKAPEPPQRRGKRNEIYFVR